LIPLAAHSRRKRSGITIVSKFSNHAIPYTRGATRRYFRTNSWDLVSASVVQWRPAPL
jgi:hypothetical protein